MFSRFDKAWAAMLAVFLVESFSRFIEGAVGFVLPPDLVSLAVGALTGLIAGGVTWLVPNKHTTYAPP